MDREVKLISCYLSAESKKQSLYNIHIRHYTYRIHNTQYTHMYIEKFVTNFDFIIFVGFVVLSKSTIQYWFDVLICANTNYILNKVIEENQTSIDLAYDGLSQRTFIRHFACKIANKILKSKNCFRCSRFCFRKDKVKGGNKPCLYHDKIIRFIYIIYVCVVYSVNGTEQSNEKKVHKWSI